MTEDSYDKDFLDLIKPKPDSSIGSAGMESIEGESAQQSDGLDPDRVPIITVEPEFEPLTAESNLPGCTARTVGLSVGGGCLLLVLVAAVIFAFTQVFARKGDRDDALDVTSIPTQFAIRTPAPTPTSAEPVAIIPLVSSDDVRVPVALPERLMIGETAFMVQAVHTAAGAWPEVPPVGGIVNWAYGTIVNYILGLAPTPENENLLTALQAGDTFSLHMSSGLILNFSVDTVTVGALDESAFFAQVSPQLTLALLSDDPTQRRVVTAIFSDDQASDEGLFSKAVTSQVGTPAEQGPVRVMVIEDYIATADAGLPAGAGYLLVDFMIENVGAQVLQTENFQTFVSDAAGERYPLTLPAFQFARYGLPTEPLAPGERVVGSAGYLVPDSIQGQANWVFNPLPGSDYWVTVPLPYDLPAPTATPEPLAAGFARVTVESGDVFVDRSDNLLVVGLEIQNVSEGTVVVEEQDVSLSSSSDGQVGPVSAGPLLPWTVEPGERRIFELHFELPSSGSALLNVLGYTFSIDNILLH